MKRTGQRPRVTHPSRFLRRVGIAELFLSSARWKSVDEESRFPPFAKSAKDGAPGLGCSLGAQHTGRGSHPSQKREGWGTRLGLFVRSAAQRSRFPPFAKSAKDGAPGLGCSLGAQHSGRGSHPSQKREGWGIRLGLFVRSAAQRSRFPPFAKSAKDGAPGLGCSLGAQHSGRGSHPSQRARRMGHPAWVVR